LGGHDVRALTVETQRRLEALFSSDDRVRAARILTDECADNLPFHDEATPRSLERIRFAALKLSGGRIAELESAVALAKLDWRDLLVAADFAHDTTAHESWFPDDSA
jgi:hypothetical protein